MRGKNTANTMPASLIISKSLSVLEEQEEEYMVVMKSAPLKDQISSLKLGLRTLGTLCIISSNKNLRRRIRRVVYYVLRELHSLSGKPIDGSVIQYLDNAYSNLREKMTNAMINPKTGEFDSIFPEFFKRDILFKRTNEFIQKSFSDLLSCKTNVNAPSIKEQLILLQALLITYVADSGVSITKQNKELFTPLVALLDKAACIIFLCFAGKMDQEMELAVNLSILLEKNKVKEIYVSILRSSKSEIYLLDSLMKLIDNTSNSIVVLNDACAKLCGKLKFLRSYLADLPHDVKLEKSKYLESSIEAITSTTLDILSSCYDKYVKEDDVTVMDGALDEVIDRIENIQAAVDEIELSNYPKIDALGFLDLFLGHIEELLECRPDLIKILKSQIEILKDEFDLLRSFLTKIKDQCGESKELEDIWTHVIHLAYQAEHVIDSYLVKSFSDHRIKFTLSKIVEKIKLIQTEVTRINDEEKYVTRTQTVEKTSSNVPSEAIGIASDEVVGFEDEANKIMEFLVGGTRQRDVQSIVGLPGLGKTTLARKMYEKPILIEHFDVRAWCTVSQTYQTRELLLTMLGDITKITKEIQKLNDEQLAAKLYQSLKGRRYLIVIDDLWHSKAFDALVRSLPDDGMNSRILITSRLLNVATKVGSKVHLLREFSDNESWELFEKKLFQDKLFQKESFSENYKEVGKLIVESCKKLPLAIVVIASLLSKEEKSVDKWKQIAVNLSSRIFRDSESPCKAIFNLSYTHLPNHLKSCFLYFGAFAEDQEIRLSKLKLLWMAEGFVQKTESENLEDTAEEYFMDLISRSLVIATKERSLGGVKACRVHDLVRDFCLEIAQEESFLQVIHSNRGSEFSRAYDQHRLSIYSRVNYSKKAKPSNCSVRSLFLRSSGEDSNPDVSFIHEDFKLLRVLDLGGLNVAKYVSRIEFLIHLRYLSITANISSIPPSISNLWNLQSFFLKTTRSSTIVTVHVPDSVLDMVNLRHLQIYRYTSLRVDANRPVNSNIEMLRRPWFISKEYAETLLRKLPKLRQLKFTYLYSSDCFDPIPVLDFLDQLTSLNIHFDSSARLKRENIDLNFPSNLQKLTLMNFPGHLNDVSRMGRMLPNLEVLKITHYNGMKTWLVRDGDFPKLKYLKLHGLSELYQWICLEDPFPILETLVMKEVLYLREIPPCFGELPTLKMISVDKCCEEVRKSARRIRDHQQEEWQNYEFKAYIGPLKQQPGYNREKYIRRKIASMELSEYEE